MKRPTGVTILAVIAIIYGVISLLVSLLGILGLVLIASGVTRVATTYGGTGNLTYAVIGDVILGTLYLVFGIGALRLKRWAWTTGVVALVLDALRQIVGVAIVQGFSASKLVAVILTVVVAAVALWYLFRPNVRVAFGFAKAL